MVAIGSIGQISKRTMGVDMRVILFNGPPRSGKDTAADAVAEFWANSAFQEKFALPLKRTFGAVMDSDVNWQSGYDHDYEPRKEEIIPLLGISYRQFQIDFSEEFMKRKFGQFIFGKLLVERIKTQARGGYEMAVISDCGFGQEVQYAVEEFGAHNCLLIRCHRAGCDFSKDSRNYVYHDNGKLVQNDIFNNGTIEDFTNNVIQVVQDWY